MKYECKSCGLECSVEANFEPTVCLKTGVICYGWHKVTAPAPKPLSCVSKSPKSATQESLSCKSENIPDWSGYWKKQEPKLPKLPDWVKIENWVWNGNEYGLITEVDGDGSVKVKFNTCSLWFHISMLQPARVRPWTFEEAPLQVKTKDDVLTLYFTISDTWEYKAAKRIPGAYSLEEVTKLIQADGSPCGVLEVGEVAR